MCAAIRATARPAAAEGFRSTPQPLAAATLTVGIAFWSGWGSAGFGPLLASMGILPKIQATIADMQARMAQSPWGVFWLLVGGGFAPIPMKIFTWASGIVGVPMLQYLLAMAVGRGKRVYLLAAVIRVGGERAEATLRRYIEPIGWVAMVALVAIVGWLLWRAQGA